MTTPVLRLVSDEQAPAKKKKVWVVAADMGFGHLRATYPLRDIAEEEVIIAGKNDASSQAEKKLWKKLLRVYEAFSRARSLPLIGKPLFNLMNLFLRIPSFYPIRNLSNRTFQVSLLSTFINRGLCFGIRDRIRTKSLPLVTSFYAPAIAADMDGHEPIYCIICDADLNRVWVAKEPWESRINYFAPCGKSAQRLQAYGVPSERIFLTGFPLPEELLGGKDLSVLKQDLGQRLLRLDPKNRFWPLNSKNVEHFLGKENCTPTSSRPLTLTYVVGGAGAQREIGRKIATSLQQRILQEQIALNLVAGTKEIVRDYFLEVKETVAPNSANLQVHYSQTVEDYFMKFNSLLRTTDILWTKPSELSFYCALGLPIIMSPVLGSQEYFNRRWLLEIQAGMRQENPEYTDQWLFDALENSRFADMAWSGFLKARKLGTYKILEILQEGKMSQDHSPLLR